MELQIIKTDEELERALAEVEEYFISPPDPGSLGAHRFDQLTEAITAFEREVHPIDGA